MAEIVAMARATPATTGVCLVSISLAVLQVCGARWDVSPGWLVLRPWTLVTATLVEPTLWHLLITLPLLMLMARYFETRWGSRSLLNMLAITAIGVNLCMCLLVLIVYISTSSYSLRREELLFDTPVGGMSGILPAFIVCFKQVVPQHKLTLLNLKLRVKQLPSALLLVHLVLAIFGLVRKRFLAMHMFGVVISWVYLRFYKLFQGSRGDSSETFSFTSFFPARWRLLILTQWGYKANQHVCVHEYGQKGAIAGTAAQDRVCAGQDGEWRC